VRTEQISLPALKIIWGEKDHEGNALQVDSNYGLKYLNFPALRSKHIESAYYTILFLGIEDGNMTIKRSPDLCYMDPRRDFVAYSEFLGNNFSKRLRVQNYSGECEAARPCSDKCEGACFGPEANQCQTSEWQIYSSEYLRCILTVYRRVCLDCESQSCYQDAEADISHCCDDACAGGCYGDGREMCVACKRFEQDGKCVNECDGIYVYRPNTLVKEELPVDERRYFYGRSCVRECPRKL